MATTPAIAAPRYDAPIGRTAEGAPVYGERAFMDYIAQQVFLRIGGAVAPTNSELAARSDASVVSALALATVPDPRAALQALAQRVSELEAELRTLRRPVPDARIDDIAAITLGARAWR